MIGSVGRGEPWPLSDVDLLVLADRVGGRHPAWAVRAEEKRRNEALHCAGIANDVEAWIWTLTPEEAQTALSGRIELFLEPVGELPWAWEAFMAKAHGGRVVTDPGGTLGRLIERWDRVLFSDTFRRLSGAAALRAMKTKLADAISLMSRAQWPAASFALMRMAHEMTSQFYLSWGRIPQSLSRGVTRFIAAASDEREADAGEWFLEAARLKPEHVRLRFEGLPPAATTEHDRLLAIRKGAGEDVDEVAVTQDLLHVRFWVDVGRTANTQGPFPKWTGVSDHPDGVRAQCRAVEHLIRRLQRGRLAGT